jgi:hypothetical protein
MNSATSALDKAAAFLEIRLCNQCGATDKKLSVCGRCHIERYCSQTCQAAAWPAHKKVCAQPKQTAPENIRDVAVWSGKKFGELRGHRTIEKNIRILSHTGGFAIFLPPDLWRRLDFQVPLVFPENEDAECWIAGKGFALVKFDVDLSALDEEVKEYASADPATALNKIEGFAKKNFFENRQAYPDSSYFTHGSFKDNPNMPRPFRMRFGGNFQYQF